MKRLLLWLGFVLTLAALGIALALAADSMRPVEKGNAEAFWSGVWGVLPPDDENRQALGVIPTGSGPYLYVPGKSGIYLHGEPLAEVSRAEVFALWPKVIEGIVSKPPDGLTVRHLEGMLGHKVASRESGLAELAARREEIASSEERMEGFLAAAQWAWAENLVSEFGVWHSGFFGDRDQCAAIRLNRSRHWWANIAFEAVFLGGVLAFVWLPILLKRCRRWLPVIWGSLPLVVLLPYFLGYCRAALLAWPDPRFWGGALYPWVLHQYLPLKQLTGKWELDLLNALPQLLEPLSQNPYSVLNWVSLTNIGGGVGFLAPALAGLAVGLLAYALQALARCHLASGSP